MQNVMDGCVEWTGPSIHCCGITNGEYYDTAIVKLANKLCDHIESSKADLGCLYSGDGSAVVPLPAAVQSIISKLCYLTTNDIVNNSSLGCLAQGGNSIYSASIPNREMKYSVTGLSDGVQFVYDMSEVVSNLPADYTIGDISVKVTGSNYANGGRTLLSQSDKPVGGMRLTPDRFPVTVKAELDVNTPDGTLRMEKYLSVSGVGSSGENRVTMDIDDLTGKNYAGMNQTQVNEVLASATCQNKFSLDALKDMQVAGCEHIEHPSTNIHSVIQIHDGKLCEVLGRLEQIGSEKVSYLDCDGCTTTTKDVSLQSALSSMAKLICDLRKEVEDLKNQCASKGNCNG